MSYKSFTNLCANFANLYHLITFQIVRLSILPSIKIVYFASLKKITNNSKDFKICSGINPLHIYLL
jgi:hypothetical protein